MSGTTPVGRTARAVAVALVVTAVAVTTSGCTAAGSARPLVAVTTNILGDVVTEVVGDDVDVAGRPDDHAVGGARRGRDDVERRHGHPDLVTVDRAFEGREPRRPHRPVNGRPVLRQDAQRAFHVRAGQSKVEVDVAAREHPGQRRRPGQHQLSGGKGLAELPPDLPEDRLRDGQDRVGGAEPHGGRRGH